MIEPAVQKRRHFGLPLGRDRTGERHVETELVEDVGVPPRGQVGLLRRGQAAAPPALELGRLERSAQGLECPDDARREVVDRLRRRVGHQGKEGAEHRDAERRQGTGDGVPAEIGEHCFGVGQRRALSQAKRRLHRRMKSVAPRLGGERLQLLRTESVVGFRARTSAPVTHRASANAPQRWSADVSAGGVKKTAIRTPRKSPQPPIETTGRPSGNHCCRDWMTPR